MKHINGGGEICDSLVSEVSQTYIHIYIYIYTRYLLTFMDECWGKKVIIFA